MSSRPPPPGKAEFELLVEGVRDYAIFLIDADGRIQSWNLGARLIKQYTAEEVIGRSFSIFYTPEDIARKWPEQELQTARAEGRFEDYGWRLRKDGTRFWANVTITALRDPAGRLLGFSKITRDLTDRKREEEVLRRSEERFRLLVEGVQDYAIFLLSPEGEVASWNAGARRIKGYEASEIVGRHFSNFYAQEEIKAGKPWAELAVARQNGRAEDEGWRLRKDGSRFWARVAITALYEDDGKLHGFAKVTQDLTRKRQSDTLEDAASKTNAFLAVLAHELRNPLAPILSAADLMKRIKPGDANFDKLREIVTRQSENLLRIVNDLIDTSRIARGSLTILRRRIALQDVVQRAVETARPGIDAAGHELVLEMPEAPVAVLGDELRLAQALTNLLNNAARYTEKGGRIEVSLMQVDATRGMTAKLSVRDTGRGIAPGMLNAVFGMFVQGGNDPLHQQTGLGVGLALARSIAELHHGTLEAFSAGAGRGSEFVLCMPVAEAEQATVPPKPIVQAPEASLLAAGAARGRVLVVDDNVDAAQTLASVVGALGFEVQTAHDGVEALRLAETFRPQIVLLDLGMPGMNGLEVARRLRERSGEPDLQIVAVTGWGKPEDIDRTRAAGFDRHLVKPVEAKHLRDLLEPRRLH